MQVALLLLAFLTGFLVPFQLALNGQLGAALKNTFTGTLFVFAIGVVAMAIVLAVSRTPLPNLQTISNVPATAWAGGLLATLYIVGVVFLVPRVGVGTATVLIIAGQLTGALLLDHFGAFGNPEAHLNIYRLGGLGLVVGGALLINTH